MPLLFLFLLLPLAATAQYPLQQWKSSIFWDTVTAPAVAEPMPEKPTEEPWVINDDTELYVHFPGGDTALRRYWREHIQCPDSLRGQQLKGLICIHFRIDQNGKISNVSIIKSLHPALDMQVLQAVAQMPNWVWDDAVEPSIFYQNLCLQINIK